MIALIHNWLIRRAAKLLSKAAHAQDRKHIRETTMAMRKALGLPV